ncbi:MAG: histidine kinase [Gemmatimonadota bacterium]
MTTPPTHAPPRRIPIFRVAALFGLLGLLTFTYHYLDDLTRGHSGTFGWRAIDEFTGAAGGALAFPLLLLVIRRWPLGGDRWRRSLPIHFVILIGVSLLLTTWNLVSRTGLHSLFGMERYDYGIMAIRYPMEFANHIIIYALLAVLVTVVDQYHAARQRELHTAQLESELTQAQLHNLRLQLNPHFLFNALNTISSVMYEDPARADRMLTGLSELLRLTLRAAPAQEATLRQELEILERYLEIQRARFETRLSVTTSADPETLDASVPQLLLQPLVENAVRHGVDADGRATIEISVHRDHGNLRVSVRDHGPGLRGTQAEALNRGVGLANTASRLQRLYGADHQLALLPAAGGGLEVRISVPFHSAPG